MEEWRGRFSTTAVSN